MFRIDLKRSGQFAPEKVGQRKISIDWNDKLRFYEFLLNVKRRSIETQDNDGWLWPIQFNHHTGMKEEKKTWKIWIGSISKLTKSNVIFHSTVAVHHSFSSNELKYSLFFAHRIQLHRKTQLSIQKKTVNDTTKEEMMWKNTETIFNVWLTF